MPQLFQVTVTPPAEPPDPPFVELVNGGASTLTVENLGPETVYLSNVYGEADPTFSADTWYRLPAGRSVSYSGGTSTSTVIAAATVAATSRVNVTTTP